MPHDRELMRMHVEALYTHDEDGRMISVNEPGGKSAPRFFLGRTAHGSVWRFHRDLDDGLARELEALCRAEPPGDELLHPPYGATKYADLLARAAPVGKTWAGPAYRFPEERPVRSGAVRISEENAELLRPHLEAWLPDVANSQPLLAAVAGAAAVSVCGSVRITAAAHEAGVETAPEFRGRGYAVQVASAWAAAVRDLGRIPLYSTSWENAASQAVARALGLRRYGADLSIA